MQFKRFQMETDGQKDTQGMKDAFLELFFPN